MDGSEALRAQNYFHELLHSVLSPDEAAVFAGLRAKIRVAGYDFSHFLKYTEEVLGEMNGLWWSRAFRAGRVWENASTWQHFLFAHHRAFKYYGISRGRVFVEGAMFAGLVGSPGMLLYYLASEHLFGVYSQFIGRLNDER